MSLHAGQQRLNEQGGKKCVCGRWEDYARVDGDWALSRIGDEWDEAGEHDCEDVTAGDLEINARLCLLCQAGPVDECNETGTLVTVRAPPVQRVEGGPIRCCDMWDTRCPTCDRGSEKSCFMRCKCSCEGCLWGGCDTHLTGQTSFQWISGAICWMRNMEGKETSRGRGRRRRRQGRNGRCKRIRYTGWRGAVHQERRRKYRGQW